MKQRKKSFGMRISAFVLSFAMVCTLLAGLNVVAFAADDASSDTVAIWCGYYAPNGDHLYRDEAEIDKAVAQNHYVKEDLRWYAPKTSSTKIKSAWNQYTGEHLLYHDTDADNEFIATHPEWVPDEFVIYSDDNKGVPIYRMFNPAAVKADTHIYVTEDKIAEGILYGYYVEDDAPFLYGVKEDQKDVVTLTDLNGFQADGTALTTDKLQIVFGSSFGTPKSVAWYKDGAVVKVYVDNIAPQMLQLVPANELGNKAEGQYYAVVENTKGESYTTKPVTVVDEGDAIVTKFTVNDNYDGLAALAAKEATTGAMVAVPTLNQTTNTAVIDITLNKDYVGNLYLFDTEYETVTADGYATALSTTDASIKTVTKASEFTNEKLAANAIADTGALTGTRGLKLVNSDGTVSYKFLAGAFTKNNGAAWAPANAPIFLSGQYGIERGCEYVVAFDDDDEIEVGMALADIDTSVEATVPYVLAPDDIEVSMRQSTTVGLPWQAKLTMGGVMDAQWVNFSANTAAGAQVQMHLYTANDNKGTTPVDFTNPDSSIVAGVITETTTNDKNYVLAVFEANEGIFGEDSVLLASDVVETSVASMDSMKMSEVPTSPKDALVEFTNLRNAASGTVFILQGDSTHKDTVSNILEKGVDKAVGMARVEGGSTEVVVENVFKKVDTANAYNNQYIAVFVPDDTLTYSMGAAGDGSGADNEYVLQQFATGFKLDVADGVVKTNPAGATTGEAIVTAVKVTDQFGNALARTVGATDALTGFVGTHSMTEVKAGSNVKFVEITVAGTANVGEAQLSIATYDKTGVAKVDHTATAVAGQSVFTTDIGAMTVTLTNAGKNIAGLWAISAD